jgi:AcrR family transcriptional regulator
VDSEVVKKHDVRKKEIVQAARHLFLTQEYDKTSMQNIVDFLDIAKGTIYHYFTSKEELLEAVVEDIIEEDHQYKRKFLEKLHGNALEKIKKLIGLKSIASQNKEIAEKLHQPGNVDVHHRLLAKAVMKDASLYADLISQGCKEGLFHTDHPLECAEFMLAGIQFLTDIGIHPWKKEDLMRRIQAFPELIESLLKAPQGSFQFLLKRLQQVT